MNPQQPRIDGKKPNIPTDSFTVSVIKALYGQVPIKLLAAIFGLTDSAILKYGLNIRRANVEPCSLIKAKAEINNRFKSIVS